jgi:ElaB/YqjD/DUF883 family membrane-anchored ribosome-binding protein
VNRREHIDAGETALHDAESAGNNETALVDLATAQAHFAAAAALAAGPSDQLEQQVADLTALLDDAERRARDEARLAGTSAEARHAAESELQQAQTELEAVKANRDQAWARVAELEAQHADQAAGG